MTSEAARWVLSLGDRHISDRLLIGGLAPQRCVGYAAAGARHDQVEAAVLGTEQVLSGTNTSKAVSAMSDACHPSFVSELGLTPG